jgi:hypothetical protein
MSLKRDERHEQKAEQHGKGEGHEHVAAEPQGGDGENDGGHEGRPRRAVAP